MSKDKVTVGGTPKKGIWGERNLYVLTSFVIWYILCFLSYYVLINRVKGVSLDNTAGFYFTVCILNSLLWLVGHKVYLISFVFHVYCIFRQFILTRVKDSSKLIDIMLWLVFILLHLYAFLLLSTTLVVAYKQ